MNLTKLNITKKLIENRIICGINNIERKLINFCKNIKKNTSNLTEK